MIAFDCPNCRKPLIVSTAKAGMAIACPGCATALQVPPPAPPSRLGRNVKLLFAFLLLAVGLGVGGIRLYEARRPQRIHHGLVDQLGRHSPQWQGVGWEKCDAGTGEYKVSVFYLRGDRRYAFQAVCYAPVDQTFVLVDPSPDQKRWLATLVYTGGEAESYHYQGDSDDEKEELENLAKQLADSLNRAIR
jgi:hypothetical protein